MAILIIDSKDNAFLRLISELVKKVKGAKAQYIETNDSIEDIEDRVFLNEMINSSKSGLLSKTEVDEFIKELEDSAR